MLIARHDVGAWPQAQRAAYLQGARETARTQLLTLGAGIFVAGALWFTAGNFFLSREGQVTDRYTKAVELFGSDKMDARIGSIYALQRIAYESGRDHPTVMQVLCTLIRDPSPRWPSFPGALPLHGSVPAPSGPPGGASRGHRGSPSTPTRSPGPRAGARA